MASRTGDSSGVRRLRGEKECSTLGRLCSAKNTEDEAWQIAHRWLLSRVDVMCVNGEYLQPQWLEIENSLHQDLEASADELHVSYNLVGLTILPFEFPESESRPETCSLEDPLQQ